MHSRAPAYTAIFIEYRCREAISALGRVASRDGTCRLFPSDVIRPTHLLSLMLSIQILTFCERQSPSNELEDGKEPDLRKRLKPC